jgi:hypothetical protein
MTIRKIKRNPSELGALELFAQLDDPSVGGAIDDPKRQAAVLARLSQGLKASLASESVPELRHPERRTREPRKRVELHDIHRLDLPLGAEDVLAMAG